MLFREKSYESQTEDESSHSAEASNLSTTQRNVSEEGDLTESMEDEEKYYITEKHIISVEKGLSEEESVNRLPAADAQSDELSGTEEEKDSVLNALDRVDRAAKQKDSSSVPDRDIPQTESESTDLLSFSGVSNVDVCAQELGMAQDEAKQETAVIDKDIVDSEGEENTEVEEPVVAFGYSGLADVDVCATELRGTEQTVERATAENDSHDVEEENMKPQPEETLEQSSLSQYETPEGNQQEAEDQAEKTKEEEGTETETPFGETHESLAHTEVGLDSNVKPKEDSLVEISFDDVPEAQILEMQQEEESREVTAVETDQNISGTQHHDEPEMEGAEKEFTSEMEEMESQHKASDIRKEKVDTNDFNLHDSDDDETGEGVRTISSSHQPTTKADKENLEDETDHMNEDSEKIREGEFCQNEDSVEETKSNDFKEDKTTDTVGGDKEDIQTEDYNEMEDEDVNDGGAENHPSLVTQSNTSAAMEAESESLGASAQHLPEERQRALAESHPEDTGEEKGVTLKEAREVVEEGKMDSEVQEKSDVMCEEESISLAHIADRTAADHQGEERPLGSEKDTTEPESKSSNKVKLDSSS